MATCDCPHCNNQGASSTSNLTDCIYCHKCAKRVNVLFDGLIRIQVQKDKGSSFLSSIVDDCLVGSLLDDD